MVMWVFGMIMLGINMSDWFRVVLWFGLSSFAWWQASPDTKDTK